MAGVLWKKRGRGEEGRGEQGKMDRGGEGGRGLAGVNKTLLEAGHKVKQEGFSRVHVGRCWAPAIAAHSASRRREKPRC